MTIIAVTAAAAAGCLLAGGLGHLTGDAPHGVTARPAPAASAPSARSTVSSRAASTAVPTVDGVSSSVAAPTATASGTTTPTAAASATSASLTPVADSYVQAELPTANFATTGKIVASHVSGMTKTGYLRFAVTSVPAGATGVHAVLRMSSSRVEPSSVQLHSTTNSWQEATLTYRTAPAVGPVVSTARPAAGAKTLTFDLGAAIAKNGTYSFAMTTAVAGGVAAPASRESSTPPRLTLTWTVPAPSTPAPGPSSTPPPPTTGTSTGATRFGASVWPRSGETYAQALARVNGTYGGLKAVRYFFSGLPSGWNVASLTSAPVSVSFKAAPADIVAGKDDALLRSWFAAAPKDRPVYWTYFHEPEDDIARGSFTAAQFRAAFAHVADLAKAAGNPQLRSELILMAWSLDPASGRHWTDYYPGAAVTDVLGWDAYNLAAPKGRYDSPDVVYGPLVAASSAAGKPWAIAETGSTLVAGDDGTRRAAWLTTVGSYLKAKGALFATYFDCPVAGEFRLLDSPSQSAWRGVVSGS